MLQQIVQGMSAGMYVRPAKVNIFIVDLSGSMGWCLRQLAQDAMKRIDQLPRGDALLLGGFSSEGWFRWFLARELNEDADYAKCKAIVQEEFHTRGMTCFSEILTDAPKAVSPFLGKFPVVTITLFSDGCPVVRDIRKEDVAIEAAANALAPLITAGSVLAYGDYSDRPRLSKIAKLLGVEFITVDSVEAIGETLERNAKRQTTKRKRVKLPKKVDFAFTMAPDGTVTTLDAAQEEVLVDESSSVYAWSDQFKGRTDHKAASAVDVQYGAALTLLLDGRIDDALNFLSVIGDVALVQALGSAITNAELARVELMIREAVVDESKRFTKGQQINCLPKEDCFDVIDLVGLLMDDEDCKFYPNHKDFKYKRIGRATQTQPNYPKFQPYEGVGVPISTLVGHSSQLNLSVLTRTEGTIELSPNYGVGGQYLVREKIGLPKQFPTHIWRNYSIINDAKLNVTKMPVSIGNAEVVQKLVDESLLSVAPAKDEIVTLDLSSLPTCNKRRGKEAVDWQRMAELGIESLRLGSVLKVLKAKRLELDPKRESERSLDYTPDQWTYLEAHGVDRKGAFSPPTVTMPETDQIDINLMEVKVDKGSPVSMKQFAEQQAKGKLNFVGQMMQVGDDLIKGGMPQQKGQALVWLDGQIKAFTENQRMVDKELNARRFAIALTGQWAKHFKEDSKDFMVPVIDEADPDAQKTRNHKVTLSFRTVVKKI